MNTIKRVVSKNNVGNAGEYYMASILSSHDFVATITLGRAETYDIIAVSDNGKGKVVKISVKTRLQKDNKFTLGEKDERGGDKDGYYAFVMLNDLVGEPDYWIVPSMIVNQITKESHKRRIEGKSTRKDTSMRNFNLRKVDGYPDNWEELLKGYYKNIDQMIKE